MSGPLVPYCTFGPLRYNPDPSASAVLVFRVNENSPRERDRAGFGGDGGGGRLFSCCLRSDFTSCRPTKRSN